MNIKYINYLIKEYENYVEEGDELNSEDIKEELLSICMVAMVQGRIKLVEKILESVNELKQ